MSCAPSKLQQLTSGPEESNSQDLYISWLQEIRASLFPLGGMWWRPYHRALVPAALNPKPVHVSETEAQQTLRRSRCLFLRHFTRTFECPTEFWYVACREYDFDKLSANTRSKLRRGQKRCCVRRITGEWLAEHGYSCYAAAHTLYEHAPVLSPEAFEANETKCLGGPFECWGVFIEEKLGGYARCVVDADYAATLVLKFDPAYLKSYSAYALIDAILTDYVRDKHKLVTNGFRSLSHDTNMQQFLEQFAFYKVYCDMRLVYRTHVRLGVDLLYPFRSAMDHAADIPLFSSIPPLLAQEQIRRSFPASSPSTRQIAAPPDAASA